MDYTVLDELLKSNPLMLVDKIITEYSIVLSDDENTNYEDNNYERVLNYFMMSILEHLGIDYGTTDIEIQLFSNNLSDLQQKFIAVCLLRLLLSNDNFFPPKDVFRNKAFALFDRVFENNIYKCKEVGLTRNTQGFTKESKLKAFLEHHEKHMKEICNINALDNIDLFKKNFLANVFSQNCKIVIYQFIPEVLLFKERLLVIFNAINEYNTSIDRQKIINFNKVQDILIQYIEEAKEFSTVYCVEYLLKPFERINNMIKKDFENSPLSKPARLVLKQTEKKYPFNVSGSKFRIGVFVKNQGKGHAFNTEVNIVENDNNIKFFKTKQHIGEISTEEMLVEFDCEILSPQSEQLIIFNIIWENFDGTNASEEVIFEFEGQNLNINWDELKYEDPYSWEPVESEERLIGRKEIVDRLWTSIIKKDKISSFYIHGQKRVGKTSIVKTLKSKLQKQNNDSCIVLYLEGGEYKDPDLPKTITNLGNLICDKIKDFSYEFSNIETPVFNGALGPLTRFLDKIEVKFPNTKILFILDEFDEISSDIFLRGAISDSLFLTIRAISNKNNFGFLLVGGEKMDFIISCQGEQLNKFQSIRVDYFDKGRYLNDFHDLARKPVENIIEFTDRALDYLYNQTSGNPFFTIIVCGKLFLLMINKRDAHVTDIEMKDAINEVISESDTQIFAHFWEDGIKGKANEEEEISIIRRKVLISIAQVVLRESEANKSAVVDEIVKNGISENDALNYLKEFVERQILNINDNKYTFKLNIFKNWLVDKGVNSIITTFSDKERYAQEKLAEENAQIKSEEIKSLLEDSWSGFMYNSKEITIDSIRTWLNQFGTNTKQRLMFKILQNLTVYTEYNIKQKMREIYICMLDIEKENLVWKLEGRKRKRNDILVSYLESNICKSGTEYSRLFTAQNNILASNAVERTKIANILNQEGSNIKVLLFVDDFIGTGKSISDNLETFVDEFPEIKNLNIKIYIGVITGFLDGKDAIIEIAEKMGLNLEVFICNPLHDEHKCFHEKSNVFLSPSERMTAKDISYEYGIKLVKNNPHGYGDCQSMVVFPNTCPNDSLPILWASNSEFKALFPRKL